MSELLFKVEKTNCPLNGDLVYYQTEYSFDFINCDKNQIEILKGNADCISLCIGTLQFEMSIDTGKILYPWGYYPLETALIKTLSVPTSFYGELSVIIKNDTFVSGVSIDIPNSERWQLYRDADSGWIFIGDIYIQDFSYSVEFAQNVIASLVDDRLVGFWMKPQVLEK
ncbi:hypothetical protein PT286_03440 [Neisseriaceae bacterium ESL0693]|nr:hypothetical protein [Neisseriaceae bacterium ESL0693]